MTNRSNLISRASMSLATLWRQTMMPATVSHESEAEMQPYDVWRVIAYESFSSSCSFGSGLMIIIGSCTILLCSVAA